jgi:hypothetical protein
MGWDWMVEGSGWDGTGVHWYSWVDGSLWRLWRGSLLLDWTSRFVFGFPFVIGLAVGVWLACIKRDCTVVVCA